MLNRPAHQLVLESIKRLVASSTAVDATTIINDLELDGKLAEAGGKLGIITLTEAPLVVANLDAYIKQANAYRRKQYAQRAGQALTKLSAADPNELDASIEQIAGTLVASNTDESEKTIRSMVHDWAQPDQQPAWTIPYPWPTLNRARHGGGFGSGQIIVIGGYTGSGKSWAGIQLASAAAHKDRRVLFASIEMDHAEITDRILLQQGVQKQADTLDSHTPSIVERVAAWPMSVMQGSATWGRIKTTYLRHKLRGAKPDVIIIDHLHLLTMIPSSKGEPYRISLNNTLAEMKGFASSEGVAIVLLAQFNRRRGEILVPDPDLPDAKPRKWETEYPRPGLSSLRESGGIENIANNVLLLWRMPNREDELTSETTIIQAKVRNGTPAGGVRAFWDESRCCFVELDQGGL